MVLFVHVFLVLSDEQKVSTLGTFGTEQKVSTEGLELQTLVVRKQRMSSQILLFFFGRDPETSSFSVYPSRN